MELKLIVSFIHVCFSWWFFYALCKAFKPETPKWVPYVLTFTLPVMILTMITWILINLPVMMKLFQ